MEDTKTAPATVATPATPQAEPEFKAYIPEVLGLVECNHCGLDFDLSDTKSCNPFKQYLCGDCLDIYFAQYEPPDQY